MEMPNLSKQLDVNINDLYKDLRANVDFQTARTTTQLVASTNYTIANNNSIGSKESMGGNKENTIIHNVIKLDGRVIAETTTPYINVNLEQMQSASNRGGV